jgi:hypothetical protein
MNIITAITRTIRDAVFGVNPITVIHENQNDIVVAQAKVAEKVSFATLNIEDAVDAQLDNIRQTVASAFASIGELTATGAVHERAQKALVKADREIAQALSTLDAAI